MSPVGIFLFEIDDSFGPKIIADFYLSSKKVSPEALKELSAKHKKDLIDATYKSDEFRYYSSKIEAKSINKELYLGFILNLEKDLVSLKSVFESTEKKIIENYSKDKKKMETLLKKTLSSILSLMEKLKEPKIIQEKINEKTKQLLDDGKLQEARGWIELGEKIPNQISAAVKQAEEAYKQKLYKKAKKFYWKAADLAKQIQETEMVDILKKKGETVANIPDYIKKRENLNKEIKKRLGDLVVQHIDIAFKQVLDMISTNIVTSNQLEDNDFVELLEDLKVNVSDGMQKALDLVKIDKIIKELIKEID